MVATVLTVYGIETAIAAKIAIVLFVVVATVLTVYGIETLSLRNLPHEVGIVATVLTVHGIETH